MCRFIAYAGQPMMLADLLYRPSNSLINQSSHSRERPEPLNGDGFGVGWYVPEIDPTPCVQRSVTPAWANRNLQNLSTKMRASLIFAHVRAASPGMAVNDANVHPFAYGRFMFMHNGSVAEFHKIKRALRSKLADRFYNMIQGTTDSEHAFALFLNNIQGSLSSAGAGEMRHAMFETITQLNEMTREENIEEPSYYNFAATNGKEIVASRYCSIEEVAASLHVTRGSRFECGPDGTYELYKVADDQNASVVVVSSEVLTDDADDFPDVPQNHLVIVKEDLSVEMSAIEV
jgi:predicted glutamine amidotransferase